MIRAFQQRITSTSAGRGRILLARMLAVGFLWLPTVTPAATLGELEVRSPVGSRFHAVLAVEGKAELSVADAATYADFGLERPALLDGLRIGPPDATGRRTITSDRPIDALVLDLLLVAAQDGAAEIRHYPVLLDFPAALTAPVATPAEPRRALPAAPTRPPTATGGRYGPVQPGETLGGIAGRLAADGASVDAVADAIFALNPTAFVGGNRNRLLAGAVLALPAATPSAAGPARGPVAGEAPGTRASAAAAPPADATTAAPAAVATDRLELAAPEDPETLAGALADWVALDDTTLLASRERVERDLNFARSEIRTFEEQNASLRSRIENLEERVASLRRVMALQAELEREAARSAEAPTGGPVTEPVVSASPDSRAARAGVVPAGSTATALPDAAAAAEPAPYAPDYGNWPWFPYVGGLIVCILCGLLFYLRSRDERTRARQRYARFHAMQQEVRSYLPDEL